MRATIKKTCKNLALGIILTSLSLSSYATSDGTCGIGYITSILLDQKYVGDTYFDVLVDNTGFIAPTVIPSETHNAKPYIRIHVQDTILWESMLKQAQMAMATRMSVRISSPANWPAQEICTGTAYDYEFQVCVNEADCNYNPSPSAI